MPLRLTTFNFGREPISGRLLLAVQRDAILLAMAIAGLTLVGWVFDIAALKNLQHGLATMKVNTALSCLLLGGALLLARRRTADWTAQAMALAGMLLGALTLFEHASQINLGIDEALLSDGAPIRYPGRMAPATAFAVTMLGAATWASIRGRYWIGQLLTLPAGMIGLLAIVGHTNDAQSLYELVGFSSVAFHTAGWIVLLVISLLFFEPEKGAMRLFAGDSLGSVTARRLMPTAILAPLLLSWLSRTGESAGYYDANVGAALVALGMMTVLGGVIYLVALGLHSVDMDRRRALQAEAAGLRRLRHANTELQQFAYSISHDIRGPLATILGLARLAGEDLDVGDEAEARRSITEIERSATSLTQLVHDTLELTRTDLVEAASFSISVAELAQEICDQMQRSAADHHVDLRVAADREVRTQTQPTRLKCILRNLIENAIKYRDPSRPSNWVRVSISDSPGEGVRIDVADNGMGIPQANWKDVFTVYRRFHPDAAEGSGVGLALVRRQTACLGGTIDFHSSSEGTTFTVRLPPTDEYWTDQADLVAAAPQTC